MTDERPPQVEDNDSQHRAEQEQKEQQARLEKEQLEKEQLEKEQLEKEQLEKEQLEKERLEKERLEKERLEKERLEKERLEKERLEKERLEKERLEKERLEKERLEQERLEQERLEQERLEAKERERRPPSQRTIWSYSAPLSSDVHRLPLRNCPAVDAQGRVFACLENKLLALEPEEEGFHVLWEYSAGGVIPGSPCIGQDGAIRFHSSDGFLHMVDAAGSPCFEPVAVGEPLGWASPLTDEHHNTWICQYSGGLLKIDSQGQKTSRPFLRARSRMDCTGFIHAGVLYVGSENACVFAVDLSGEKGKNLWDHARGEGRTGRFINAALARSNSGLIIAASCDDRLYAFRASGEQAWSEEMPGPMLAAPVVAADDSVYVACCLSQRGKDVTGVLIKVDGRSHKIAWQYPVEAAIESTPVIGNDGAIYFGDNNGFVHAIDSSGREQWKDYVGTAVRSAGAIIGKGRLAFGLDNGSLVVLRCESDSLQADAWPKYMAGMLQSGLVLLDK